MPSSGWAHRVPTEGSGRDRGEAYKWAYTGRSPLGKVESLMEDTELVRLLSQVEPRGRDVLRRLMRAEQREHEEFALALERQRTDVGRGLAELLDLANLHPGDSTAGGSGAGCPVGGSLYRPAGVVSNAGRSTGARTGGRRRADCPVWRPHAPCEWTPPGCLLAITRSRS